MLFLLACAILAVARRSKGVERRIRIEATMFAACLSILFWLGARDVLAVDLNALWVNSPGSSPLQWLGNASIVAHTAATATFILLFVFAVPVLWFLNSTFLAPVMADSARYFSSLPENVNRRHEIRKAGVRMLRMLHKSDRKYKRIIIVGHSLGSVVAHAVLSQYWGAICKKIRCGDPRFLERLARLEESAMNLNRHEGAAPTIPDIRDFRTRQRELFRFLASKRGPARRTWLVSDLVTLGSPLTDAPFLLSETRAEFDAQQRKHRRYAACPPLGDVSGARLRIGQAMERGGAKGSDAVGLPHSSPFAATRWTNLYFKTRGYFRGDIVAGPVAPMFGPGVLDVALDGEETEKKFTHNAYWRWPGNVASIGRGSDRRAFDRPPQYLIALRRALNLFDSELDDQALAEFARSAVSAQRDVS
jgi:hypothetical protein